jgi:hypothetical protein
MGKLKGAGAGKSTVVKLLIEQQQREQASTIEHETMFATPVVGAANDHLPTSGDVHLYADPESYWTQHPRLYADCEGMEGGEKIPRGAKYKGSEISDGQPGNKSPSTSMQNKLRKKIKGAKNKIKWVDSPEKGKREYAVKELYPRLLYTFSDVVIFVLSNAR